MTKTFLEEINEISSQNAETSSHHNKKKKSIGLLESVSCVTRSIINDSTMHGLPRVFKAEMKIMKVIWFITFLGAVGYCAYSMNLSIQSYLSYSVVTNIDTKLEIPAPFRSLKLSLSCVVFKSFKMKYL